MHPTFHRTFSLDTINNAAFYHSGKDCPKLKRNQSPYLLRLLINKLYGASKGFRFKARIRASHEALAAALDLSRVWVCHLVAMLREAGWIRTDARRLPNGKQEITTFRPGGKLLGLLVSLRKSPQRTENQHRVNDQLQKTPSKEEIEKNLQLLRGLQQELAEKMSTQKKIRW